MNCLLCYTPSDLRGLNAFECPRCALLFKNPKDFLSSEAEAHRYSSHQNISTDQGYIDFLSRLVNPLKEFLPEKFVGLDFGCGPGPTLSVLLKECGGSVVDYDPLFFPNTELLVTEFYDVVTSSEVVEHFNNPKESWDLLVSLVKKTGKLAIMTQMYSKEIDYEKWWYKNDPTHVVFYQQETWNYLAECYTLEILSNDNKAVIIFEKRG